jgi:predicted small lipoprotein YifL
MRRQLLTLTALAALAGLAGCDAATASQGPGAADPQDAATDTAAAATTAPEGDPAEEEVVLPELVSVLAGTWEGDLDETGPHGSTLTIEEDATATLLSFASQAGTFEGTVFLADGDPMRFEGTIPEDGAFIVVGLQYDEDADILTLEYPDGETYDHTRA